MSVRHLDALFQPASVAVIGASDRVGSVVLRNLKRGGFKGPLWPVNRRHDRVNGTPAWSDLKSLPEAPNLAVICTPASTVPGRVAELGRKGTRAAIVLTPRHRWSRPCWTRHGRICCAFWAPTA